MKILGLASRIMRARAVPVALVAALCCTTSWGAITGTAYIDFNGNGVKDAGGTSGTPPVPLAADVGVGGVTVTATGVTALGLDGVAGTADDVIGACGAPVTSSTAAATLGAYSISTSLCLPGTIVRVEFSTWPAVLRPGLGGATTVQFVSANATNVDLPLLDAGKFCENNPQLATSCYVYGNNLTGPNNAMDVLVSFPLSAGGTALPAGALPAPSHIAVANQMGSTYGLAWQPSTQRLFAAAYLKYTTGFGPSGPGAIYAYDKATGAISTFVDINSPAMTDAARPGLFGPGAAGTDPFPSADVAQIGGGVGKVAWGDIDLSVDGATLYALNMANLRVYAFPANGTSVTTSSSVAVLPALPFPTNTACSVPRTTVYNSYIGLIGAYAMGMYVGQNEILVGARCSTGNLIPNDNAYVFRFDISAGTWDPLPVFTADLAAMHITGNPFSGLIGDLAVSGNDLILTTRSMASDFSTGPSVGQVFRACKSGVGAPYVLESNGSCGTLTGAGSGNGFGPGSGQFFAPDAAVDGQLHSQQGGLAFLGERNLLVTTSYDQFALYSAGASYWNATTGANIKDYQLLQRPGPSAANPYDAKAGALGELEVMCRAAPVEIGNRIWNDLNRNGIQDPNEPALAGVTVELRNNLGALLATAVTDANGNYLFSNDGRGYPATGSNTSANGGFSDDGQGGTSSTTASRYGVLFKTGDTVNVVIPNASGASIQAPLAGLSLTATTAGANTSIDSNFVASGTSATTSVIVGAPGANDHTIDAGFAPPIPLYSIGDLVWNDANNNGKIDGAEAPLTGAKVEVFTSDAAGNPTGAAIGSITTDATGRYRFDGLAAGDYVVVATPPAGYVSSTGTAITAGAVATDELDNGKDTKIASGVGAGGFPSAKITLGPGSSEPTAEKSNASVVPAAQVSGAGGESPDNRSDRTVDFGFYLPFDLKLTKAITSAGPYIEGSTVTFTLRAENLGPGSASGAIIVKDKLPAGLIGVSATGTNWACSPTTGAGVEITCNRAAAAGALAAGASADLITVTTTIAAGTTGTLVNTAQVNPDPADASKAELIPLGTTNSGYEDGTNASGSNNDDSKSVAVGALTYSIGDLVWNDTNNNGKIDGAETPLSGAKVEVFSSDAAGNPTGAAIGSITTDATGRYRFDGLAAGDYVVVATPPAGYVSSTGTAITAGAVATDELDNGKDVKIASGIGAGGFPSAKITLGPSSSEPVSEKSNTTVVPAAGIAGAGGESPDNRSDRTVDFGFYQPYDLKLTKAITSAGPYIEGSTVTFTLRAENLGPGSASGAIIVKDKLPAGLIGVSATGTNWACSPTTGAGVEISCNRAAAAGALASGAAADLITVTTTIAVGATGSLVNSAQVNPDPADASKAELIPLGTTNAGYEDGTNATGSNNDDSKSVAVGALTYSIGDLIWADSNNNGKIDGAEVPLSGVKVNLYASDAAGNPTGTVLGSVTTDATGRYRFDGLAAGDYVVVATPPAGYVSSTGTAITAGAVATDELDNGKDTKIASGVGAGGFPSAKITLGPGSSEPTAEKSNASVVPAAQVSGAGGESPDNRSDRTVDFGFYLPFDLKLTKAITSAGPYIEGSTVTFTLRAENLGPGSASGAIIVKDKLPAGLIGVSATGTNWTCSPTTGAGVEITCNRAAAAGALAAGASADLITVTTTIAAGATGTLVNTAQVNPDPADASKAELIPLGTTNSGYEDGTNASGSNNDDSKSVAVGAVTFAIGNRVWLDTNNNGVVDAGEIGLDGVAVRLINTTTNAITSTTTANGGYYLFAGLAAGTYKVEITPPNGYASSTGVNGSATGPYEAGSTDFTSAGDNKDHGTKVAGSNVITSAPVTVGPGLQPLGETTQPAGTDTTPDDRTNLTVDFGLFAPASLGTVVWIDNGNGGGTANDGVKQPGEPGIAGVTARLLNGGGAPIVNPVTNAPITTTTDANGNYAFGNLIPGTYQVEFVFPAGTIVNTINPVGSGNPPTNPAAGGTDAQRNEMNATTRRTPVITLAVGSDNPNLDAGVRSFDTNPSPPVNVPTLNAWMLMLLAMLMIAAVVRRNRRA